MKAALLAMLCACRSQAAVPEVPPDNQVWLSDAQMTAAGVRVEVAADKELPRTLSLTGKVAFDDMHVTHVYSPVTGRIARVLAKPGAHIARGTPLVAIMSPDVGGAFADVVKAQADLQASEADFRREQRLSTEDATSKRSLEAAQDAFRRASAEYARSEQRAAQLSAGNVNMITQEYVLRAPIEGDVITRTATPGAEVAGQYSGGTAPELFTIGDIKDVWVTADVPEAEIARVKLGQPVEVKVVAYPGRLFRGKVEQIAATVDPVLRTARIRCELANADEALKPEMFATVDVLEAPEHRIVVPRDAVVAVNEATYVFVETGARTDGRHVFEREPVDVAPEREGVIPVTRGIRAGDRIVVDGSISRDQPNDEVWPSPQQLAAANITTAKVEQRAVDDAVAIGARLAFDDTKIAHVFSPVNGRVTRVIAQLGQRVTVGSPLAAITSPDLATFLSDVAKADADRVQAGHEVQRQRELVDAGVGAKRDLETAEAAERKAVAEYDRAKQLAQLLKSSNYDAVNQEYILRSPIAGEVLARHVGPGLEVQGQYANGGSSSNVLELFTIGDSDPLWVIGEVYELDLARVREGDDITIEYGGKTTHGTVDWISDVLDPTSHTAKVRCVIANPQHLLRPEMYARAEIHVPGGAALGVPRNALLRVDGATYVFVRTGERKPDGGVVFERRRVKANLDSAATWVPVTSGLKPDEVVAVDHSVLLLGML